MCVAIQVFFVNHLRPRSISGLTLCTALFWALCGTTPVAFASNAVTQIEASLPPLVLMTPLSQLSLDALTGEADAAYAAKNFKASQELLQTVLDLAPGNRRASFRLANIYQQRGQLDKAVLAYRQTAEPNEFSEGLDEFAEKALINIAIIGAEHSRSALAELEKRQPEVKNQVFVKRMFDDLSDTDAILAARIARLSNAHKPLNGALPSASQPAQSAVASSSVSMQIIQGTPATEPTGLAEVVYASPAAQKLPVGKRQSAISSIDKRSR
jgi:tetratricopeptide (TPR) repeat protein